MIQSYPVTFTPVNLLMRFLEENFGYRLFPLLFMTKFMSDRDFLVHFIPELFLKIEKPEPTRLIGGRIFGVSGVKGALIHRGGESRVPGFPFWGCGWTAFGASGAGRFTLGQAKARAGALCAASRGQGRCAFNDHVLCLYQ